VAQDIEARLRELSGWYNRLSKFFWSHWDEQQRVYITGVRPSGDNMLVRFLASRATLYVRVHIQHDGAGGGGESYDNSVYVSDARVDCRLSRQQDTTIERATADNYFVWLIPEFLEGDRSTYTRYDDAATGSGDHMSFVALGANSQEIRAMKVELINLNEKLERLLSHASLLTKIVLNPGEKL